MSKSSKRKQTIGAVLFLKSPPPTCHDSRSFRVVSKPCSMVMSFVDTSSINHKARFFCPCFFFLFTGKPRETGAPVKDDISHQFKWRNKIASTQR